MYISNALLMKKTKLEPGNVFRALMYLSNTNYIELVRNYGDCNGIMSFMYLTITNNGIEKIEQEM